MKYLIVLLKVILTVICLVVGLGMAMSFERMGFWMVHSAWWIIPVIVIKFAGVALAFYVPKEIIWKSKNPQPQAQA